MATPASAAPATSRRQSVDAGAVPHGDDAASSRPRLDVVERRRDKARSARRQVTVLRAMGAFLVVGTLGITAAAHTFVASDQQRIDALQIQLSQTLSAQQNLQIARAELESPTRVLSIAEHRLGMVAPGSAAYLAPVNPGPSVEQAEAAKQASASSVNVTGRGSTSGAKDRKRSGPTSQAK